MDKVLPKGWEVVKSDLISDITDYVANGSFQSLSENVKTYDHEEYAILLRLKDFNSDFRKDLKYVDEKSYKFLSKSEIEEGDLFISNVGNPGMCYLVPNLGKPITLGPNGIRLRVNKYGDTSFIKYYLQSPQGRNEIREITTGTAQLKFNKTDFRNLLIPLPPLAQQERIVDKLDKLLAQHERINQVLDRIPQLLKTFRKQVLTKAVTGKLTEQWREGKDLEEWTALPLKEVCFGFKYGSSSKSQDEGKVAVLRMGNLQNGKLDLSDLKYSNDEVEIRKYSLEPGDVLFNRTNSPELVGKTSIYRGEIPAIYAGYLIKIENDRSVLNSDYLNYFMNTSQVRTWCNEVKSDGVSQSNINAKKLGDLGIPLPPLQEQQEIVAHIETLFAKADNIESSYQVLKAKIDTLPQAILHKAFKGELVSQLPTDGDAKDLLAEIMALKKGTEGKRGKL